MGNEVISDDGRTLTVFVEEGNDIVEDKGGNDIQDGMDDLVNFDVSKVPEEHRNIFEQLVNSVKEQKLSIDNLKTRSDMVDLMKTMLERKQVSVQDDKPEPKKREKLVDKLKFADDDYYAPFFKVIAGALDEIVESQVNNARVVESESKQAFETRFRSYLTDNKLTREVIAKMDELASTLGDASLGYKNPAFKDLKRLHKLACAELGIKFGEESVKKIDDSKKNQNDNQRKPNPKNRIEMSSSRKGEQEPKKINSMKDAFEKAKEDLANR
ncbi:MAG TPA: hypothetical protein DDX29_11995 [Clostridiales bacterium]|nr:hypothetical protein [Clostridiales bacterium]